MLLRLNGWKNTDKVYYLSAMMPRVALLDRVKSQGSQKFSILFLNRRTSINFLPNSPCKIAKWMASEWTRKKSFFLPFVFEWKTRQKTSWREASRAVFLQQQRRRNKQKTVNANLKNKNFKWTDFLLIWKDFFLCYSTGKFWHFMLSWYLIS
mgnify:CR=1 FL=1